MKVHIIGERGDCNEYSACSYLRVVHPFRALAQSGEIDLTMSLDWRTGIGSDVFIVQRDWRQCLCPDETTWLLNHLKSARSKLIYEIDDNLLDLPQISMDYMHRIRALARHADLLTVSTPELAARMRRFNSRIAIIPNYLSIEQAGTAPRQTPHNKKTTIGYMGTLTHQSDFQMIKLPLLQLLSRYRNLVQFELIGAVEDAGILGNLPNVRIRQDKNNRSYDGFWEWLQANTRWDIGLAPLKLDAFTRCKSDIKFLDYAAMGCCGVFSDHPAYRDTVRDGENGFLANDSPEDWYRKLEALILDSDLRQKLFDAASRELYGERLLERNLHHWQEAITLACRAE